MAENDIRDTSSSISEDDLLMLEVIGNDAELYFLDCFLSEVLPKG